MKLYYTPGTVSLAAHIALDMSGINYQAVAIDFSKAEQKGEQFLAINPLGRVPALITDEGVITEVIAILNYVSKNAVDRTGLLAKSNAQNSFFKAKVDAFNSFLSSTVHVGHAHLWRSERWATQADSKADMAIKATQNMQEYFELIEQKLFIGPWVQGEQFSSSDILLFVITRWLEGDGVDPTQFEKVNSHYAKMLEIPEVTSLVNGLHAKKG